MVFGVRSLLTRLLGNGGVVASDDCSCRETTTSRVGFTMLRSGRYPLGNGGIVVSENRSCGPSTTTCVGFTMPRSRRCLFGNGGVVASENRRG